MFIFNDLLPNFPCQVRGKVVDNRLLQGTIRRNRQRALSGRSFLPLPGFQRPRPPMQEELHTANASSNGPARLIGFSLQRVHGTACRTPDAAGGTEGADLAAPPGVDNLSACPARRR